MALFSQPIRRTTQPTFAEGSGLASVRDARNTSQLWKKNVAMKGQGLADNLALASMQQQMNKLKRRQLGYINSGIGTFQIVSDGGDWYNCYSFDGLTAGTTIIKVAKNQDLRCILPSASPAGGAWVSKFIRGVTYSYTYTPTAGTTSDGVNVIEYVRSVTGDDATSATEYVTPCLNCLNDNSDPVGAGDIIEAFSTSFAGPETLLDVTWQAFTDGRAWAGSTTP